MKNKILRAATTDKTIRAAACVATELVETARQKHGAAPTATAALGRALIANIFLALDLKGDDLVTLRIIGDGPLGAIITQADARHMVRGYVQEADTHLPPTPQGKLDVGGAVGKNGFVYVTKDLSFGGPYTGCSALVSGEIGEDIALYLNQSEQTPAVVAVGVLIDTDHSCIAAGGFFLQALPGAADDVLAGLEEIIQGIPSVTQLIAGGLSPQDILEKVFGGVELEYLAEEEWSFDCGCNKERLEKLLISLGREELEDMLGKEGQAELRCHFCNERYFFDKTELERLLAEMTLQ
ncbi:MAG: Hsp33 family molecular chaperone HslO [Clostridia bacterium]|nr:Hsp33 family molecular chaperone HslO [Clostridia bacterium]